MYWWHISYPIIINYRQYKKQNKKKSARKLNINKIKKIKRYFTGINFFLFNQIASIAQHIRKIS